jgi:hypothetical protein
MMRMIGGSVDFSYLRRRMSALKIRPGANLDQPTGPLTDPLQSDILGMRPGPRMSGAHFRDACSEYDSAKPQRGRKTP